MMAKANTKPKSPPKRKASKNASSPAKRASVKPSETLVAGGESLDALYADWYAFMPREAKASKLEFVVVTPTGRLTCTLRFQFYCYIDTSRSGYVGDTLRDAVKAFVDGGEGSPAHPQAVFEPGSLKVSSVPPGYARAEVKSKLSAILSRVFSPA